MDKLKFIPRYIIQLKSIHVEYLTYLQKVICSISDLVSWLYIVSYTVQ